MIYEINDRVRVRSNPRGHQEGVVTFRRKVGTPNAHYTVTLDKPFEEDGEPIEMVCTGADDLEKL